MKKLSKRVLLAALGAAATLTTIPFALVSCKNVQTVGEDNGLKLPTSLLDEIHSCVSSALGTLTSFNNQNEVEKEIVDKVNQIIQSSGVTDLEANSIQLEFRPSGNGTQTVVPTLSFNNAISGSSNELQFSGDKLSTTVPIETQISDDLQQDQIHLNDVESEFWAAITSVVNTSWKDKDIQSNLERTLVTKINDVISKLDVSVSSVKIDLILDDNTAKFKEATVTTKFNRPIATTNNPNWTIQDDRQTLVTRKLTTGISVATTIVSAWNLSTVEAQIYNIVTSNVNTKLTDINKITSVQNTILNSINSNRDLIKLGVNASAVKIDLENSSISQNKIAKNIIITFNNNVTGTSKYFNASGNTITIKSSLQTGIPNIKTTNGWNLGGTIESQLMTAITNNVRTTWTNIYDITQKENAILNTINNFILKPYSINAKSVKIQLDNTLAVGCKTTRDITITFSEKVEGTTQYFNFNGYTLSVRSSLQTGIPNLSTLNGFDFTGIEDLIYEKISQRVGNFDEIYEFEMLKTNIRNDISEITTKYGIKPTSVDITLGEGRNGYQVAKNIEVWFNNDIHNNLTKFEAKGQTQVKGPILKSKTEIQTSVPNYFDDTGALVLRDNVLSKIRTLVDERVGKYWNKSGQISVNGGMGNEQFVALVQDLNKLLPINFPAISNVTIAGSVTLGRNGKEIVNINVVFNGVSRAKIVTAITNSFKIYNDGSGWDCLNLIEVKTAIGCLYFSQETQTKLVNEVTKYVYGDSSIGLSGHWNRNEDGYDWNRKEWTEKPNINNALNIPELKNLINNLLPKPAVPSMVKDIRLFGENFLRPQNSGYPVSNIYKYVALDIVFNDNFEIWGENLERTENGKFVYPDSRIFASISKGERRIVLYTPTEIMLRR